MPAGLGLVSYWPVPNSERAVFCQETRNLAASGRVQTFRFGDVDSVFLAKAWLEPIEQVIYVPQQVESPLWVHYDRKGTGLYMYSSSLAGPLEVSGQYSRLQFVFSQFQETSHGYHFRIVGKFLAGRMHRGFGGRDPGVQGYTLEKQCKRQFSVVASYDGNWKVMKFAIGTHR